MNNLFAAAQSGLVAGFDPIYTILSRYHAAVDALENHPVAPDSEWMHHERARLLSTAERELLPFGCPPLGGVFTADQKAGHDAWNGYVAEKSEVPPVVLAAPVVNALPALPVPAKGRTNITALARMTGGERDAHKKAMKAKHNATHRANVKAKKEASAHADVPNNATTAPQAKPQVQATQNATALNHSLQKRPGKTNHAAHDALLAKPAPVISVTSAPVTTSTSSARLFDAKLDGFAVELNKAQLSQVPVARAKGIQSEAAHEQTVFFLCLAPDPLAPKTQIVQMQIEHPDEARNQILVERCFREGDGWFRFGAEGHHVLIGRAQISRTIATSGFVAVRAEGGTA